MLTGAFARAWAALSPPNPPPTITTCGNCLGIVLFNLFPESVDFIDEGALRSAREETQLRETILFAALPPLRGPCIRQHTVSITKLGGFTLNERLRLASRPRR